MERRFQVTSVKASFINRTVEINCSADLDEETVSSDTVILMTSTPRAIVPCAIEVDGRSIVITLENAPVPNTDYLLLLDKGIKTITDDPIETIGPIHFSFKSAIVSTVRILSPSNFSKVGGNISIKWREEGENLIHRYYFEAARDNVFSDIILKNVIDKTAEKTDDAVYEAVLPEIEGSGQYYIRIRAESEKEAGIWSETVSFIIPSKEEMPPKEEDVEKPRPELPNIIDYTEEKTEKSQEKISVFSLVELDEMESDEDIPTEFVFSVKEGIDLSDISVKVGRKAL